MADSSTQLQLPLDAEIVPRTTGPALDPQIIKALRAKHVEYMWTRWSSYWQEWEHHVMLRTQSSRHMVVKTDEGIAALLREAKR
jgi:hypothetical protein